MSTTRNLEETAPDALVDRRYVVRREIARGGMGGVFEAEHVVTRAKVALKTLTRPALDFPAAHARLMREGRVLGAIRHPNVVIVQDAGSCPKYGPFLALDMIEGRPLDGVLLARQRLAVDQAIAVLAQLADALDAIHRRGIVHRDLKPSNVMIARTPLGDQVRLIDFGIAAVGREDDITDQKLTKMGELLGTAEYMAPEQLMGSADIDARADVYAAGALFYECLAGEPPFPGTVKQVMAHLVVGSAPPSIAARRDDVSPALDEVIAKALAIEAAQRFDSIRSFFVAAATAAVVPNQCAIALLDVKEERAEPLPTIPPLTSLTPPQRRRQHARAPYVTPARIVLEAGTCDGRTEDISEGGVLVVTNFDCAGDQNVKLRMPLPASGRVVVLEGVTRWVTSRRAQRAVGIEFVGLADEVRNDIRTYVGMMTTSR